VVQETPTLLSGLTVKARASCCTGKLREPAPYPNEPNEENRAKSITPEARNRAGSRLEIFNV